MKVILKVYDVFKHKVQHAGMQPNYVPLVLAFAQQFDSSLTRAKCMADGCLGKGGAYLCSPESGSPITFVDGPEVQAFVQVLRRDCHVSVDVVEKEE